MIFFMRKLEHKERQQATMRSCDDCRMLEQKMSDRGGDSPDQKNGA